MAHPTESLAARLARRFQTALVSCTEAHGETSTVIARAKLPEVCRALRDEAEFRFEQLIDLCGVDYADYGKSTHGEGGLTAEDVIEFPDYPERHWSGPRYAVVYHLLSVTLNQRLRVKTFLTDEMPLADSVMDIWPVANWYEREAFDLFGIVFEGHPDLRRLLTDYGFIGHPMRKDFPLIGQVEMRYDPEKQRVVYQPVSIENRVLVPRVIRQDSRYAAPAPANNSGNGASGNS